MAGDGSTGSNKAPQTVLDECHQDPKKHTSCLDKCNDSENGDWVEIDAKQTLTESSESSKTKDRNLMFPFQMTKKFGAAVAKTYQDHRTEIQKESGETNNDKQ